MKPKTSQNPSSPAVGSPGVVYLIGGGPGDPGLITLRGAELLARADVVLHDELVHPALLDHVRPDAEIRFVGKRGGDPGSKQTVQTAIEEELVRLARAGRCVVRLKGGDPFLFGRGSEEAEALVAAGVPFEVVPGITSPFGATAYAGISLTHRDLASSVTIVSATGRDGREFDWSELASGRGTICVLMGMRRLEAHIEGLIRGAKRAPETPAAVIQWGTRSEQRVVEGRLDEIADRARAAGLESPAVIVVGQVASLRRTLRWFDARPLFGKRVLVTRPAGQAAATSEALRRRGAEPIEMPAIQIGAPPDPARVMEAVRALDGYDVVAFTSENGVDWFFRALSEAGKDARAFGRARVATIGPGTAAALLPLGIRADIVPAEFRGESLAEAILADPEVKTRLAQSRVRVLVPRALVAREVLGEMLRAAGCEVDIVPVYETRRASAERREELVQRLEAGAIDVALLTSSSTADSVCDLLGARAPELLRNVVVASIGPITTKTAEKRGLTVAVTATESTTAGLITALEHHFGGGSTMPLPGA
ncbi:Uroporphyrinogen-III methyltransferase [Minicystis rosea]|nr:Uroporphyrinogen-III methyltransferase [Minicystis rosea]